LKKYFIKIINLYIFLNFHVAFSVVATYLIFGLNNNENYVFFLFFSTVFSYGFIRLIDLSSNRKTFKSYFYDYRFLFYGILILSFLSTLYFYFKLDIYTQLTLIPLSLITVSYQTKLRKNGLVKLLTVAFIWAMLTTVLPIDWEIINIRLFIHFIYVFLYILMLTLSFDQRDILIDQPELKTLAQLYPHKKQIIYLVLLSLFFTLNYFIFTNERDFLLGNLMILISIILCFSSDNKKNFYYTAFWIEALPVIWLLLIIIQKAVI